MWGVIFSPISCTQLDNTMISCFIGMCLVHRVWFFVFVLFCLFVCLFVFSFQIGHMDRKKYTERLIYFCSPLRRFVLQPKYRAIFCFIHFFALRISSSVSSFL